MMTQEELKELRDELREYVKIVNGNYSERDRLAYAESFTLRARSLVHKIDNELELSPTA